MTKRFLVTGGLGFLGSNFVRRVAQETAAEITVVDKMTYAANPANMTGLPERRVKVIEGDVADGPLMMSLVGKADTVVHFAAESHNDFSLHTPNAFVSSNVQGTFAVLEAARAHDVQLHHVSTDEVYGSVDHDTDTVTESSPYNPSSPYSATKASSDLLVKAWVRSFGVRATVSNGTNVYGPYQHVEKFIPRQITHILNGQRPQLYGDGQHVREWTHVVDHTRAVMCIVQHGEPGESYLIGSGVRVPNVDVVRTLLRHMGGPEDAYAHVSDRPGHDDRYAVNTDKLRTLGWRPQFVSLADGLAHTIDWYRTHQQWWEESKVEAERRYSQWAGKDDAQEQNPEQCSVGAPPSVRARRASDTARRAGSREYS